MRVILRPAVLRASFALALVVVFVLALLPAPDVPKVVDWQDKVEHAVLFALLGLLGLAAWARHDRAVVLGLVAHGLLMEIAQSLTAHRHGDPWDWVADTLGVAAALLLARVFRRLRASAQ